MSAIIFLEIDEIIELHKSLIDRFGGAGYGIRDSNLLDSAVHQAELIIFGEYVHKSLYEMAAAYCYHIVKNHAFIDGNKRIGLLAAITFLSENKIEVIASWDKMYEIIIQVATSQVSKEDLALFFQKNSILYRK